jgi:hypothetical protein
MMELQTVLVMFRR